MVMPGMRPGMSPCFTMMSFFAGSDWQPAARQAPINRKIAKVSFICSSIVKTIAQLRVNFARVVPVRAAEGEAIVEQHAAVGDVEPGDGEREAFTEVLAEREVERGMGLQVGARLRGVPVGEARAVVHVGGGVASPGKVHLSSNVECIALVVVEEAVTVAEGKVREAAVDVAKAQGELVGVGEINLCTLVNARRAKGQLPGIDARALNGDREKEIGVVEIVVIEKILGAGEKRVRVNGPAPERNRHAILVLFIALAVERNKAEVLVTRGGEQRAGNGEERGGLIKVSVEGAKNPVELGHADGATNARAGGVLDDAAGKVGLANAGVYGDPLAEFRLVFQVDGGKAAIGTGSDGSSEAGALARNR